MSIGSKFALVALILPILLILVGSAISYYIYPTPFLIAVVAALTSVDVLVWRELRTTLQERLRQVWDNYLKPLRDSINGQIIGSTYFFPDRREEIEDKMNSAVKYGKYGLVKLYPSKLVKKRLVSDLLTIAEDFNSRLTRLYENEKANGREFHLYYAFDHWGFRKIPPDQIKGLDPKMTLTQDSLLGTLDEAKKEEIARLNEPWEKGLSLSKQIVSILNKFSSENGIMPAKPPGNPFG